MPTSTFDVNAAYAPIAARLKTVDGVHAVCGANDLAQVINGKTTGTDGNVYLIFDGLPPKSHPGHGRHPTTTAPYRIIIASQNYQRDGMPDGVGKLIGGVMQAMAGFAPLDDDPRARQTLQMVPGERAVYAYGLSLYPLKYQLNLNFQSKE